MEVTDLFNRLSEDLLTKEERRRALSVELKELLDELGELRSEMNTLQRAAERYSPGARKPIPEPIIYVPDPEWVEMQRVEAVERMLREHVQPMKLEELSDALIAKGRKEDSTRNVSAALSHLRHRVGSVNQVGRGVWVYLPPDQRSADPAAGNDDQEDAVPATTPADESPAMTPYFPSPYEPEGGAEPMG